MKRAAALGLALLAACEAEPEGVRFLVSRGAVYALDPPAKLHVVSAFPMADGVKVSGREKVVFCAFIRYADAGARERSTTEHGGTDSTFTHAWGARALRYVWDRREDRLSSEGRSFDLSRGRLFLVSVPPQGAPEWRQLEHALEEVTPAIFEDGAGSERVLAAVQEALGEGAPEYAFAQQ